MKRTKISRAVDYIDDELISEALKDRKVINPYKNKRFISSLAAIAAVFVLIIGVIYVNQNSNSKGQNPPLQGGAIVAIDVNPALELEISDSGRVDEVRALNEDAKIILGEMNLLGVDLDVAINALIGSMLGHGYLTVEKNSILISVDAGNDEKSAALQSDIQKNIASLLENSSIKVALITQTFEKDNKSEAGVSAAKYALIKKIVSAGLLHADGSPYTLEQLKNLNVNELKLILDSKKLSVDGMASSGAASQEGLIGEDYAKNIALEKAGITADGLIAKAEVEIDYDEERSRLIYEVEFETESHEYEYEIDAKTGEILEEEREEKTKYD